MDLRRSQRAAATPHHIRRGKAIRRRPHRAVVEPIEARLLLAADPVINEFMAINNRTLADADGDFSDWIEIHNPDAAPVNLDGWYLTDNIADKAKWRFPAVTLAPDGYLVVFASDKDRRVAGQQLHTNFKLTGDGEYLGLIKPDGVTVANEFAPAYPVQQPDISYGLQPPAPTITPLITASSPITAHVPSPTETGSDWTAPGFDDSSWISGSAGVGYETAGAGSAALPNEVEPNDGATKANDASTNWSIHSESSLYQLSVKGSASSFSDSDYYRIGTFQPGDVLTINVSGAASARGAIPDPQFSLYRQGTGTAPTLVLSNDDGGPGFDSLVHRFQITASDTYFVQVSSVSFEAGSYDLSMVVENAGTPPTTTASVFSESEPNDSIGSADNVGASWRQVQYESSTSGAITSGDADWYRYTLKVGDFVTFEADSTSALDAQVTLYRSDGTRVLASDDGSSEAAEPYSLDSNIYSYRAATTGNFFVKVEGTFGSTGTYDLKAHLSSPTPPVGTSYFRGLIRTDIGAQMQGVNSSAYVRVPFDFAGQETSPVESLRLGMKYDDGFVAYLNGVEVARRNALDGPLAPDAAALTERPNSAGSTAEIIDLSAYKDALVAGRNVLAIHGLNLAPGDDDFLIAPELTAVGPAAVGPAVFFALPTPGATNVAAALNAGPEISNVSHAPLAPADSDDITVTARIAPRAADVQAVTLLYRVMYGGETPLAMLDDGAHGDGAAGDGVYGAVIPASVSGPGQMVRYAVVATDVQGKVSRAPLHARADSAEYFGAVIKPAVADGALPVFQFFTPDLGSATSRNGAQASVYFNGRFYDNVFVRDRGGNTTDGLKFDFNPGAHFRWTEDPNAPLVDEINVNYRSGDETYLRAPLSFEVFRDAGVPALTSFPMRVQSNGSFFSFADFVENVDAEHLERLGLDPNGALYKLVVDTPQMNVGDAGAFEKKTRQFENDADLRAFLTGLHRIGVAQTNFLLDNFDVFGFLSYWAANTIVNDTDDAQKNYYLYRDTQGDGRWRFLPWDKDLTFGKNYGIADYGARDPQTHPFYGDSNHPKIDGAHAYNFLIDALLDNPTIKQMYLRRLRTVMDQILQSPTTPVADRKLEQRLDQLAAQLRSDPAAATALPGLTQRIQDIKTRYLNVRRNHLYVDHAASTPTSYPDRAQIPNAQPATFPIKIGQIDFNPVSGDQGQEYIQLLNPNTFAADISGWRLSGAVDYTFPGGAVIPANGTLYVAANVADFRTRAVGPRGGQGLLVIGGYDGQLSARGETIVLGDTAGQTVDSLTYAGAPTAAQQGLRVTEIMYHPADATGGIPADDLFEFVEVQNILDQPLDLTGVRFTQGINFTFGAFTLAPGEYAVVVKDRAAFESRYGVGAARIAGEYAPNSLDDGGERIRLEDAVGEVILDFAYDDQWYPSTDGEGRSLTIVNAAGPVGTWGDAAAWRPSNQLNGSPGGSDVVTGATVAGRHVFYNGSAYDGRSTSADAQDDNAIAADKQVLLPGQTATIANQISYSRGINGVMVDIRGLPADAALSAADFQFRVGLSADAATWTSAAAPSSVTIRRGAGANGSDRVTLIWADGDIKQTWLQVTVLANDNTKLAQPDVFYVGSLIGETGDSSSPFAVTASDLVRVRNAIGQSATIDSPFDFNRDGAINAADLVLVRNRVGSTLPPPPNLLRSLFADKRISEDEL